MREPIERIANELLDRATDANRLDVAANYGFLLPAYVLWDFMGVRPEDRDRVVQWSADFVDFFNVIPITEDTTYRMIRSATEMTEHMRRLLSEREHDGRDDFMGVMRPPPASGRYEERSGSVCCFCRGQASDAAADNTAGRPRPDDHALATR